MPWRHKELASMREEKLGWKEGLGAGAAAQSPPHQPQASGRAEDQRLMLAGGGR